MKTTILLFSAIALVFVLTTITLAQGSLPPILPGAPSQAPIDGGLGLLAATGGAYAYKKLRKKRFTDDAE